MNRTSVGRKSETKGIRLSATPEVIVSDHDNWGTARLSGNSIGGGVAPKSRASGKANGKSLAMSEFGASKSKPLKKDRDTFWNKQKTKDFGGGGGGGDAKPTHRVSQFADDTMFHGSSSVGSTSDSPSTDMAKSRKSVNFGSSVNTSSRDMGGSNREVIGSSAIHSSDNRMSLRFSINEVESIMVDDYSPGCISSMRWRLAPILYSQHFEMFVGFVVIVNFGAIAFETDQRSQLALHEPGSPEYTAADAGLKTMYVLNILFLCFYSSECAMRLFIQRMRFFAHNWNLFDLFVVVVGVVGEIISALLENAAEQTAYMQIGRSIRMMRMLRASRIFVSFKELYSLVCGLTHAMKTLIWAAGLIFLVLTAWSIVAVEYLQPLMQDLEKDGLYATCYWCPSAFDSILKADLTFFQMISGDGWSKIARPLIERHPWTGLIFVSVIFTMLFGLLNLVTAVIVDSAAIAREQDVMSMAQTKDRIRNEAWNCFAGLVTSIDKDGSGDISIDELREGILDNPELAAYLTIMGVEETDLVTVFDILDSDGDGAVSHEEFAEQMYRMKTEEVSTNVCLIKHYVQEMSKMMKALDVARNTQMIKEITLTTAQSLEDVETKEWSEKAPTSRETVDSIQSVHAPVANAVSMPNIRTAPQGRPVVEGSSEVEAPSIVTPALEAPSPAPAIRTRGSLMPAVQPVQKVQSNTSTISEPKKSEPKKKVERGSLFHGAKNNAQLIPSPRPGKEEKNDEGPLMKIKNASSNESAGPNANVSLVPSSEAAGDGSLSGDLLSNPSILGGPLPSIKSTRAFGHGGSVDWEDEADESQSLSLDKNGKIPVSNNSSMASSIVSHPSQPGEASLESADGMDAMKETLC